MSKRKPEMTVTLNHDALVDAIEHYTQNMMGTASTVSKVSFTAGRGDKGYSADVTLSLGGNAETDKEEAPTPSGPVKRSPAKNKPGPKPKPEVEETPEPDTEEADIANSESDDAAMDESDASPEPETKEENTASSKPANQKRLFGSEE